MLDNKKDKNSSNSPEELNKSSNTSEPLEEKSKKSKKKLTSRNLFSIFILILGLSIMFYPYASQVYNNYKTNKAVNDFLNSGKPTKGEAFLEKMAEYNKKITTSKFNTVAGDIFAGDEEEDAKPSEMDDTSVFSSEGQDEIIGIMHIPSIDMKSPIYYGTKSSILQKGIGILENTSFPGGNDTHSILTGHRGTHNGDLFKYLDEVTLKDAFYIDLDIDVLKYEVYDIKIVEPWEVSEIELHQGKDLATLLTCDPYLINTHRLLVMGERVPITQDEIDMLRGKKEVDEELTWKDKLIRFIKRHWRELVALGLLLLLLLIILIIKRIIRRVKYKKEGRILVDKNKERKKNIKDRNDKDEKDKTL